MALILDHINGIPDDHRLANLRIVCPNCAATLDTHCGRKNRRAPATCPICGAQIPRGKGSQRYCSRTCAQARPRIGRRKVQRPPYERLVAEIETNGYRGVGRNYGVSDNAIRKWIGCYEHEIANRRGPSGGSDAAE